MGRGKERSKKWGGIGRGGGRGKERGKESSEKWVWVASSPGSPSSAQ